MTLTKQRIARRLADEQDIPLGDALRHVDALLSTLKGRFAVGEKVMITNFGTFEVAVRAPRRGISPATGERILIPAHRTVVFHPAPRLREEVEGD